MFHKGKNGKEYANPQVRDHADEMGETPMRKAKPESEGNEGKPASEEAADHDDVPSHLKAMHAKMGGTHMHVHKGEDGSMTSHHVGDDGMVEGPHQHPDMESLMQHHKEVFGDGDGMGDEMGHEGMHSLRHALGGM